MKSLLRWLCARCPLNENRDGCEERRKVSPEGRERYAEFTRERADVEERLRLVDVQSKVIEHVTRREGNAGNGEPITHG
jgi:hypothetical protein